MLKLYQKNELAFSLVWIGAYVVLFSLGDALSETLGVEKSVTAVLAVALSALLLSFVMKNNLASRFGLKHLPLEHAKYFWYIPFGIMASVNLWSGISLRYTPLATVCYVISMLGVGFLEEVIFRGLLFRALLGNGRKQAVIIASLTFGIGHVINLLNGAELLSTLLQIIYAVAAGFLFTIFFLRSGSLLPCIITHSVLNALSVIEGQTSPAADIIIAVVLTAISLLYAWWILKKIPDNGFIDK